MIKKHLIRDLYQGQQIKIISFILLFIISFSCSHENFDKKAFAQEKCYWNDLARFLAGMPVSKESNFWTLSQGKEYNSHITFMNNFWSQVENGTIKLIESWYPKNMPTDHNKDMVFYPLSGADFINLYTLFPQSSYYLMIALEKDGNIPDPLKLTPIRRNSGLASLRRVIYQYGTFNYFKSKTMNTEMSNINLTGTTPVLLIFLARLGLHISSVEKVGLNDEGMLVNLDNMISKNKIISTGTRVHFYEPNEKKIRTLIYLSMRLEEKTVSTTTPSGRFLNSFNNINTMMKSAVYLLHMNNYKAVKDFILSKSNVIVQDDSGIPFKDFDEKVWNIKLYGTYKPVYPIQGCTVTIQKDLTSKYKKNSLPLPFHFGYGSLLGKNKSNLMIMERK